MPTLKEPRQERLLARGGFWPCCVWHLGPRDVTVCLRPMRWPRGKPCAENCCGPLESPLFPLTESASRHPSRPRQHGAAPGAWSSQCFPARYVVGLFDRTAATTPEPGRERGGERLFAAPHQQFPAFVQNKDCRFWSPTRPPGARDTALRGLLSPDKIDQRRHTDMPRTFAGHAVVLDNLQSG
jgi:hypothetical protein